MSQVCPWWLAYTFDNPLRKLVHNPRKILNGYIKDGDTVMDVGCGMGYFSIAMAAMVGGGRVIAVDVQKEMLKRVYARAQRKGLAARVHLHLASEKGLQVSEAVDFVLAFWMVHEVPDRRALLREIKAVMNPGASLLIVEPRLHVSEANFEETLLLAQDEGLVVQQFPAIFFSYAALLTQEPA